MTTFLAALAAWLCLSVIVAAVFVLERRGAYEEWRLSELARLRRLYAEADRAAEVEAAWLKGFARHVASSLAENVLLFCRSETREEAAQRVSVEAFRLALRHGQDRIEGRKRAAKVRA